MNIKRAEELRQLWGNKPCDHPSFEKETFPATRATEWLEIKTGDYVCTQCGMSFTKEEKENIEANR